MTVFDRIKLLAKERGKSLNRIEEELGLPKNVLYRMKTSDNPTKDRLEALANYFDVSVDYLLGRTEKKKYYDLTDKDERSIQKQLQSLIDDLSNDGALAFSKEDGEMSEETKEALISSLENALRISKIEAKKKYTPKKYRS
ncbi:hypothetical protein IGK80_002180 [Enterococcus sp. DIV0609]|uniref:helix-turn-helix domain-containing protein n=1 Tax=Enterococcus TaxID=1350 RepID=UPI0019233DF0|nr:helix-turn-helix transcriptional regulator [Enterococcus faecalis]EGO2799435.1 helix-turn-helix transcriptional regulator [Enterococcus faecalis]EIR3705540.1 helix-turn-helix transcriptional regulator [Enterococcus faecalis]EJB2751377.1 helix-turn-helix transcriptional regulator [Enterococcus faecalis]ELU9027657.1 helix-turn-helix transcriptional regulator [Enterococcus faecalis]EME3211406.1 helix-turn-helix transcriptional regulator [Enterococcus faecalis]